MAAHDPDEAHGPLGGGGTAGAVLAWVAWWFVCAALWLSLVDTTHFHELMAGALVSVLGASVALLVRAQRVLVIRPDPRWLLRAWRPFALFPRDTVLVVGALAGSLRRGGRPRGRLFAIPMATPEEDPREAARRVLMKTAGSLAPNSYVVGADDERGLILVHQLVRHGDPAVDIDPLGLR